MVKKNKNVAIIIVCGIFILLTALCFMRWSGILSGDFFGGQNSGTVLITSNAGDMQEDGAKDGDIADDDANGESASPVKDEIAVYLCGAVRNSGVYTLPFGSRVCDAVKAAGGLKANASLTAVNQARQLTDGEQIEFPTKKQEKQEKAAGGSDKKDGGTAETNAGQSEPSGLVNINSADLAELMTLTGIGESRAQSIITYRTEHGLFSDVKDIMNVTGIKDGIYQKIKDNITV